MKFPYQSDLLYPDNQRWLNKELPQPINSDEILYNLKQKYGVYGLSVFIRVPLGIIMIALSAGISLPILNTVNSLLSGAEGLVRLVEIPILFFFLFLLCITLVASFILGYRLLLPQPRKVQASWSRLLHEGVIYVGRIVEENNNEYIYEFQNAKGKVKRGRYTSTMRLNPAMFLDAIKQDYPAYLPHPKPTNVRVWYVDDRLHTLL
jgi:hypothetical protein